MGKKGLVMMTSGRREHWGFIPFPLLLSRPIYLLHALPFNSSSFTITIAKMSTNDEKTAMFY